MRRVMVAQLKRGIRLSWGPPPEHSGCPGSCTNSDRRSSRMVAEHRTCVSRGQRPYTPNSLTRTHTMTSYESYKYKDELPRDLPILTCTKLRIITSKLLQTAEHHARSARRANRRGENTTIRGRSRSKIRNGLLLRDDATHISPPNIA